MDPFERAERRKHRLPAMVGRSHVHLFAPAGAYVGKWLQSFREFPPRQKPGSFNLDRVMEAITKGAGDKFYSM
jgi:hypothetical protein